MVRRFASLIVVTVALMTPGCIAITAADLAIGATGAVVGTAGEVVEGAVDVVTPGKTSEPKAEPPACQASPD